MTVVPRVSIIIATHSRPQLLPHAVESAQRAGGDVEVVVVDDASTDATAEVCRQLSGIRYVRLERNQRVAGARNVGLVAATAEIVGFLDDDDLRLAGSIDRQLAELEAAPECGLVYGPAIFGDQDMNPTGKVEPASCPRGDLFWDLISWNRIQCLGCLFRKSCLTRVGMINASVPGFDDWDLWVRIAELYPATAVEEPVAVWRHATPFSGQGSSQMANLLMRAAQHQLTWLRLPRASSAPAAQRQQARQEFRNRASDWLICDAAEWLAHGATRYARQSLCAALRLNPTRAARPWTARLLAASALPQSRPSVAACA